MPDFDLAIVGGGINGAGIARDAAGRGLRVLLVEQNDLASGTSSASTKLIHGGLRYLEHGWFRLVREALAEREVMLRMAPHLIRPMRFVLPVEPGLRPAWQLRLGLFVYDHLGGRTSLPATRSVDLSDDPHGATLKGRYRNGFEYSDCVADDSRLVVLNALDAAARGALIRTRTRCLRADRTDSWQIVLEVRGRREVATARVLINATGPWLGQFAQDVLAQPAPAELRLDKGSHIVVRRLFGHDRGYIFQTADGRVVFVLPYERDFTLVGTTDGGFSGDPATVTPSPEEINYLCAVVNDHLRAVISPADVVWAFAGVRSLHDDGASKPQDAMRDYVLVLDQHGRRRCSPSMAARSRPIAGWPRPRSSASPRCWVRGRPGPRRRACPEAIFRSTALPGWSRKRAGRGRSWARPMSGGWCRPMGRASAAFWGRPRKPTISGPGSAPISPAPRCAT